MKLIHDVFVGVSRIHFQTIKIFTRLSELFLGSLITPHLIHSEYS